MIQSEVNYLLKLKNNFTIKVLNVWRNIYCWIIPTSICLIYAVIYLLIKMRLLDWYNLFDSSNVNNVLEAIVTFISIVISILGVLLPLIISTKDSSEMIKWFFSVIDKQYFITSVRRIFLSGLLAVFVSCVLFFHDIFYENFNFLLSLTLIWLVLYFLTSSYRFISIFLRLLITEKETGYKKVKN